MLWKNSFGLLPHGLAQIVVEIGEDLRIGRRVLQISQEQPLLGEIVDQGVGALIGQHALHLLLQHGVLVQFSLRRQIQQLVVGRAAPQEERQARSQREIAELIRRVRRQDRWDRARSGTETRGWPG